MKKSDEWNDLYIKKCEKKLQISSSKSIQKIEKNHMIEVTFWSILIS